MDSPFRLEWGTRTGVMGVLNVTPDSFSGDGIFSDPGAAIRLAEDMVSDGADIVDIGGESTRPGYRPVQLEEELERTIPIVAAVCGSVAVPVSIDTMKPEVARPAIAAGATIINDVSGAPSDEMLDVAAQTGAGLVLVHGGKARDGEDVVAAVCQGLTELVERALARGVLERNIVVDPGLGFGKTWRENFEIFRKLDELRQLGRPILIGPSRKGMIGKVLGVGVEDRVEGTLALVTIAIANGADIVRAHDVRPIARAVRMTDALQRAWVPPTV